LFLPRLIHRIFRYDNRLLFQSTIAGHSASIQTAYPLND
jgi:hypothetical protein